MYLTRLSRLTINALPNRCEVTLPERHSLRIQSKVRPVSVDASLTVIHSFMPVIVSSLVVVCKIVLQRIPIPAILSLVALTGQIGMVGQTKDPSCVAFDFTGIPRNCQGSEATQERSFLV